MKNFQNSFFSMFDNFILNKISDFMDVDTKINYIKSYKEIANSIEELIIPMPEYEYQKLPSIGLKKSFFDKLKNLNKLEIHDKNLNKMAISNLKNLTTLNCSLCSNFTNKSIKNLNKIIKLDCCDTKINKFKFKSNLIKLKCDYKIVDEDIKNLTNLKYLDLEFNFITNEGIKNLLNLKFLKLFVNLYNPDPITCEGIKNLVNLKFLKIYYYNVEIEEGEERPEEEIIYKSLQNLDNFKKFFKNNKKISFSLIGLDC
jgi:hypothetical protein